MPNGMHPLRMKAPQNSQNMQPQLPEGLSPEDFQNLPPEQKLIIQQHML